MLYRETSFRRTLQGKQFLGNKYLYLFSIRLYLDRGNLFERSTFHGTETIRLQRCYCTRISRTYLACTLRDIWGLLSNKSLYMAFVLSFCSYIDSLQHSKRSSSSPEYKTDTDLPEHNKTWVYFVSLSRSSFIEGTFLNTVGSALDVKHCKQIREWTSNHDIVSPLSKWTSPAQGSVFCFLNSTDYHCKIACSPALKSVRKKAVQIYIKSLAL